MLHVNKDETQGEITNLEFKSIYTFSFKVETILDTFAKTL